MIKKREESLVESGQERRSVELAHEIDRWEQLLRRKYHPQKIVLFGSFAQGRTKAWSDIDMVIVKKTNKRFLDRIKEVLRLLKPKVSVDVLVYTPEEFTKLCKTKLFFKEEIVARGKVLYERGN